MWCGQAEAVVAEDALKFFKSMPRGKLWDGISTEDYESCEDRGFSLPAEEDTCYPGLQAFFWNQQAQYRFMSSYSDTIRAYGEQKKVNQTIARLLDICKCKS